MSTPSTLQPAKYPEAITLQGRFVRMEKLDPKRHGDDLWNVFHGPQADPTLWDYMFDGPFTDRTDFYNWLEAYSTTTEPLFFSIIDLASGQAQGLLSYLNIVPQHCRLEVGHIHFSSVMQRTPKSTEAIYLLVRLAFELGYHRVEWKCNDLNERSKAAALRFGYTFEGIFRNHMVTKGRIRNTAWYSITDDEWPAIAAGFERWLAADNQRPEGQVYTLKECRDSVKQNF